ncbi:MAG: putative asparagine synthase [Nitrososphaeraceae archaeon]|nr:putative asparagine synthase [Nitrososphaeraceae archaeon]
MQENDCNNLKSELAESVKRNYADALLLSGGLDSSILANIVNPRYSWTIAFGKDAMDLSFARTVATKYCKKHTEVILTDVELLNIIKEIIKLFKTFDPIEIREGISTIMTGDGGDELFAGYNYLKRYFFNIQMLKAEVQRLWDTMHFSSRIIGRNLGMNVKTPFLDNRFICYAKSIDIVKLIGEHLNDSWGKFILRKCYEQELGNEIVWRPKLAQEQGAGVINIRDLLIKNLDDGSYKQNTTKALSEGVIIKDKEQLYYYSIFRMYFSPPKEEECLSVRCPKCNCCFKWKGRFCRTCGSFPVEPREV